jgi:hypothetical protein
MTPTFRMTVNDIFAFGNKLIFAGEFQRNDSSEIKGLVEIIVDGAPLRKLQIEGEVFDNTPEPSLWATMPNDLNVADLKGREVLLVAAQ